MITWRTFVAVDLGQEIKAMLKATQDRLLKQVPPRSVRWVQPEGIHLTLKFLGDTPLEGVERVKAALARAAAETAPFEFTVGNLGCFPNTRRPRVVWVGIEEPAGALLGLRNAVEAYVAPLGFPTEGRPFQPHLTLGRVQQHASAADVEQIGRVVAATSLGVLGRVQATEVSYIRSDLQPSGAVYTTLLGARLGGQ